MERHKEFKVIKKKIQDYETFFVIIQREFCFTSC